MITNDQVHMDKSGKHKQITYLLLLVFTKLIINSCHGNTDDSRFINFEDLSKIEIKIDREIGDSDEYMPARLRDMVLASDGTMLVSDWGKSTIEQFNAEGIYEGTIARKGRGPGELPSFFNLIEAGKDTLIVHTRMQSDYYGPGVDDRKYKHTRSMILET